MYTTSIDYIANAAIIKETRHDRHNAIVMETKYFQNQTKCSTKYVVGC